MRRDGEEMATTTTDPYDIYQKKYDAAKQLVENEYQASANALNENQATLAPTYQADRNSAYTNAAQSQKAAAQNYADMGLSRSGSMNTTSANIDATRDNAVNMINTNETQAATALANRLAELNASKSQSLAGLEGQAGTDMLDYGLQAANLTGSLNGSPTLAAQQLAETIQQSQNSQALAQLEALLNYNLGVGEITEALPVVNEFTYGDAMTKLLAQIYGIS